MTEQAERYDRIAEGYARWWAPIIAPAALPALDEVADAVAAGATRLLDVGTGTGTLAIAAVRRWPTVRVTAIDASAGMIAKATAEAEPRADRGRTPAAGAPRRVRRRPRSAGRRDRRCGLVLRPPARPEPLPGTA